MHSTSDLFWNYSSSTKIAPSSTVSPGTHKTDFTFPVELAESLFCIFIASVKTIICINITRNQRKQPKEKTLEMMTNSIN